MNSRSHDRPLTYVTDVLWQVESEFMGSGTETMKDFNKLILGAAKQKLFVGPITSDSEADLGVLVKPARCCSGEVYAAFIDHPSRWASAPSRPVLYWFDAGRLEWRAVGRT